MKPFLHFIVGPTTTGKTSRSIALAELTGAPVIVLDRIQCFPDLATGSGRPSAAELRSTRRIYMTDRRVSDGELPAEEANALLHEHLAWLARNESFLILEGGSVSLLQTIATDPRWETYRQSWERLRLPAAGSYLAKAKSRILEMLKPSGDMRSMLDEIIHLWPDARSHAVLRGIVGYRTVIAYAEQCGISLADLPRIDSEQVEYLTAKIACEYLAYARQQESELPGAFYELLLSA